MRRNIILIVLAVLVVLGAAWYLCPKKSVFAPVGDRVETDDKDRIKVSYPLASTSISSPLVVRGEARGTWYFEASFPVTVVNWDGLIIGEGHAEAQSNWMTEEYVPFEGRVAFTKPECPTEAEYCKRGWVIFQKDNPSGLPEHDAAIEILVTFE